jgi:hypothetical protein
MTQDDLLNRSYLIYAAVKATIEFGMAKLPAKVVRGEKWKGFFQDFTGNLSEHDIALAVQSVIHNIASLYDHLKKWARANGKDETQVESTFRGSLDLKIVRDLWDRDKHGGDLRNGGYSHKAPRLADIRRMMKLTTQAKVGSFVTMTFGPGGVPQIGGDGSAKAIMTADVLDKDGQKLGDLFETEERSVEAWESLLNR